MYHGKLNDHEFNGITCGRGGAALALLPDTLSISGHITNLLFHVEKNIGQKLLLKSS